MEKQVIIREYEDKDIDAVSNIVVRNMLEVNSKDYAGNKNNLIGALYIDDLKYRVHDLKKNKWLPYVVGRKNYAGNMSSGSSTTISISGIKPKSVSAALADKLQDTIALNSTSNVSKNDVVVTADGKNVTSKATITINVRETNTDKINTAVAGTYNVDYSISYSDQTFKLSRIVTVK